MSAVLLPPACTHNYCDIILTSTQNWSMYLILSILLHNYLLMNSNCIVNNPLIWLYITVSTGHKCWLCSSLINIWGSNKHQFRLQLLLLLTEDQDWFNREEQPKMLIIMLLTAQWWTGWRAAFINIRNLISSLASSCTWSHARSLLWAPCRGINPLCGKTGGVKVKFSPPICLYLLSPLWVTSHWKSESELDQWLQRSSADL